MSLKAQACAGDRTALEIMFRQFVPPDERIDDVAFLGLKGIFGIGSHSFAAVTDRRVASLQLSPLGGARYRDGYHEHINSSVVFQPSRVHQLVAVGLGALFWLCGLMAIVASGQNGFLIAASIAGWLVLAVLLAPAIAAIFYRFAKSGLVLIVREGVVVYCFTDRRRLGFANELASRAAELRDLRLAALRTGRVSADRVTTRRPGPRTAPARARTQRTPDMATVLLVCSAVALLAALIRTFGLTQDYRNDVSVWDVDLRLVWIVPVVVCGAASLLVLVSGRSSHRMTGIGATVGSALVIGLQVLFDGGAAMVTGASGVGAGFWLSELSGAVVFAAAAVLGLAAYAGGLVTVGVTAWQRTGHERLAPLVLIAGGVTALGAVMPWLTESGPAGTEEFWGLSPTTNVLYGLFFACSTALCLAVPVVVTMLRPRLARAGLLFGWSAALLGWAVGYELDRELLFGFRLFETGVVASFVLSLFLLVDWRLEASRPPVRRHAVWPPPAAPPSTGSTPPGEPTVTSRGGDERDPVDGSQPVAPARAGSAG